jgi:hypothetical protein
MVAYLPGGLAEREDSSMADRLRAIAAELRLPPQALDLYGDWVRQIAIGAVLQQKYELAGA